jgi:hypothetical protein
MDSKKEKLFISRKGVVALQWSPKETFIITSEKLKPNEKNLKVWCAKSGDLIIDFEWKNTAKDGAKSLKFDDEEKFCSR